jgi:glycolate oxidase FAD binding subunit
MREFDTIGDRMVRDESPPGVTLDPGGGPTTDRPRDPRDVAEAVRAAAATGVRLRVRAGGSWLDAGRPTTTDRILDLAALSGIVDYVPGDLTLTAAAATPLAAIEHATREWNQWLALDGFGGEARTLGATLATASAGPLAASVGLPRDVALGIEVVTGDGALVRGGGRVVKNVAGFDLVRLNVGAWGTLGVLTEATVRLRARPECDRTIALPLPADPAATATLLSTLRTAPLAALAAELLSSGLARQLGVGEQGTILVRIAGNQTLVAAQHAALTALGDTREFDSADVWTRLRTSEPADVAVFRASARPAALLHRWHQVTTLPLQFAHASLERGIVRGWVDPADPELASRILTSLGPRHLVVERAPVATWSLLPTPAPRPLDARVRAAFDPHRVLNPGIMGDTP